MSARGAGGGLAKWLPEEEEEVSCVKIYVDGGIKGGSGGGGGGAPAVGAFLHAAASSLIPES